VHMVVLGASGCGKWRGAWRAVTGRGKGVGRRRWGDGADENCRQRPPPLVLYLSMPPPLFKTAAMQEGSSAGERGCKGAEL